jgi:hypothetical protein
VGVNTSRSYHNINIGAAPRQVILKDVGATPRQSTDQKPPVQDINAYSKTTKTDPRVASASTSPSKVGKAGASTKTKDWHRKPDNIGGLKRRLVSSKDAIADDEAKELNVPILGLSNVRKSRKFSKASRKAARAQAARAETLVKVEILEVGKQGMSVLELAHNLAVNEEKLSGLSFETDHDFCYTDYEVTSIEVELIGQSKNLLLDDYHLEDYLIDKLVIFAFFGILSHLGFLFLCSLDLHWIRESYKILMFECYILVLMLCVFIFVLVDFILVFLASFSFSMFLDTISSNSLM